MALTDKLKAIADAIRGKTGKSALLTLDEMPVEISQIDGSYDDTQTYILVDESGNEVPAVLVDEEVDLTATPNDIRLGAVAVTDDGVVTGEKEIPSYNTIEGYKLIPAGSPIQITNIVNCEYTKLLLVVCAWNTKMSDSVCTEKVVINDNVYEVRSAESISVVIVDPENEIIDLGITNESESPCVIRYITYKEEY